MVWAHGQKIQTRVMKGGRETLGYSTAQWVTTTLCKKVWTGNGYCIAKELINDRNDWKRYVRTACSGWKFGITTQFMEELFSLRNLTLLLCSCAANLCVG